MLNLHLRSIIAIKTSKGRESLTDIKQLRLLNTAERIAITEHARLRLVEREISVNDIIQCIETGEIIEQYEDDKPFPSCLVLGKAIDQKNIHVVVSHDSDWIYLITAYRPDAKIWSLDFKIRKER